MVFGLIVALTLLMLSIIAVFTTGIRLLVAVIGINAPLVPIFGLAPFTLLVVNLHWLIQTAHLLVGLGALALLGTISVRYLCLR
jgi:hypothetical protein